MSEDDPEGLLSMTAGEKALETGIGLGLAGGIVGAVVGEIQISIPINGRVDQFKSNQARLKGYSYHTDVLSAYTSNKVNKVA